MRVLALLVLLALASCTKKDLLTKTPDRKPVSCNFGLKESEFNTTRRVLTDGMVEQPRVFPTKNPHVIDPMVPQPVHNVILLDFDGDSVKNTTWNWNGPFYCAPSGMTPDEQAKVVARVTEDYSPFDVLVTTNEADWVAAGPGHRQRLVITQSWEWYGKAGGVSYVNSWTWNDDTPDFVFSLLLNYRTKYIAEAASHEVGHALGLNHSSDYNNCVLVNEYNYGRGTGVTSWAPIMGCGYTRNLTLWHNGPNPWGCTTSTDEIAVIAAKLGVKADDAGNTVPKAKIIPLGTTPGMIETTNDIDVYEIKTGTGLVTVQPNGDYANLDLQMLLYDHKGRFVGNYNDSTVLGVTAQLLPSTRYYIGITTVANANTTTYGQIGTYTVTIN